MGKLSLSALFKYKVKAFKIIRANRLEIHDDLFHHDSVVMLAGPEAPEEQDVTGLKLLAITYVFADDHPNHVALITGHTDRSGSDDYNIKLSDKRGENVYYLLAGERDNWVNSCDKQNKVEDRQQLLKWLTTSQGWDCDPGVVDNQDGPKTREGLKKFQQQYNVKFGKSIKEDGIMGKQTWGAFFDVYMYYLAEMLETKPEKMDVWRKKMKWMESGKEHVGCGECFPIEKAGVDGLRSSTNRRVEIFFFPKDDKPPLDCHPSKTKVKPKKCVIYASGTVRVVPIPIGPVRILSSDLRIVVLGYDPEKEEDKPIGGRPWMAITPTAKADKTKDDGLIEVPITRKDKKGELAIDLTEPPPKAAAAGGGEAAPAASPTDYPIKIVPGNFVDKDAAPVMPPPGYGVVKWKIEIISKEAAQDDESVKARLHNMGFLIDKGADDATTEKAVKTYQYLYLNEPDGSGKLADIKDDVIKRHDNA